jgi:prepilin-type processing-associated H-X9-DG protein
MAKMTATAKTVLLFEVTKIKAIIDQGQESGSFGTAAGLGYQQRLAWLPGDLWAGVVTDANLKFGTYATGCTGGATKTGFCSTNGLNNGTFENTEGRHLAGANYLLADGHVKWYNGDRVSTGFAAVNPTDVAENGTSSASAAGTSDTAFAITFSPV